MITLDLRDADHAADVADAAAVASLADEIGPIDILVNSAGIVGPNKPLLETTDDEWRAVLGVNVLGIVNTLRAFAPAMVERGWGRVVNIASMAGKDGKRAMGRTGFHALPGGSRRPRRSSWIAGGWPWE